MKIPKHLGIIVDGNRRWSRKKGLPLIEGHRQGLENLKRVGDLCLKKGIKILTVFAFSTENWQRPKKEVNYLMTLLAEAFSPKNTSDLHKKGLRIKIIGKRDKLSASLKKSITEAEGLTKNNEKGILNIALNYGGRAEIIEAVKNIIRKKIPFGRVNDKLFEKNLWTVNEPAPDLIIRTGGEKRLSNFLIWQTAYSELYFSNKLWPDFNKKDLERALKDFKIRKRRFGK